MARKHMWGEVYEPLVDDQWPHNPHFIENSHERPFSIIPKANTYEFLTNKWSPPEIQECHLWQGNIMWGEVYEPLVDDKWPHNDTTPISDENSHERPFSIIPEANTYGFLPRNGLHQKSKNVIYGKETYVG
jgi:hypothetical protein